MRNTTVTEPKIILKDIRKEQLIKYHSIFPLPEKLPYKSRYNDYYKCGNCAIWVPHKEAIIWNSSKTSYRKTKKKQFSPTCPVCKLRLRTIPRNMECLKRHIDFPRM